jgi:DNA replication protein DnaC
MTRKPESDPLTTLRPLLLSLSLTTLARDLDGVLDRAAGEAPSYSDFLRTALEVESAARLDRKILRRQRWSRLGPCVDLEHFDFAARPQLSPQAVKELLHCRFVEERRNLVLVGRPSTGKTTVARAIGHAACARLFSVYSGALSEILDELHAAKADRTYRKASRRLTQPDLLVLDDCGTENLTREEADEFFRLVQARYQRRATIVVSNLPFRQWGEFLPSPALAVAIAERLVHDATILRFTGKSFRLPREILGAPLDGEDE